MPLETGDYISDLDDNYPLGGDPISQGDNHINLIKKVLKTTFPGALGNGYDSVITATEAELNYLGGVTFNVAAKISTIEGNIATLQATLPAPTGTRMAFHQAAAPTGWVQDTTYNDYMLRVINTAGGGAGGTDSPILNDKVPSHTHTFSASTSTDGAHSHSYTAPANYVASNGDRFAITVASGTGATTSSAGSHNHSVSGTTAGNPSSSNWAPKYLNLIICQKSA